MDLQKQDFKFFDDQGYLKVEGVLEGERLEWVQGEFGRVEAETRQEWVRAVEEGVKFRPYGLGETAHVVFGVAPHSEVFVDLLELEDTVGIAERFIGPDIQMIDNALHVKLAGSKSHTKWHRDSPTWRYEEAEQWSAADKAWWERMGVSEAPFLKIKIFFFVEDVDEDTAPFSVVPGSHKVDPGEDGVQQYECLEDMPGQVKLVGKAGDAVLWNGAIWHTAMDNKCDRARRMLLFNYTHFGMKQYDQCVAQGDFVDAVRRRSSRCRQLFGLERMRRD